MSDDPFLSPRSRLDAATSPASPHSTPQECQQSPEIIAANSPPPAPTGSSDPSTIPNRGPALPPSSNTPPPSSDSDGKATQPTTKDVHSTPVIPAFWNLNQFAFEPKEGNERGPGIVNEVGMASRFHLVKEDIFMKWVPGTDPTDEEREKFVAPNLENAKVESDLYPELGKTSTSVLTAAKCTALRFVLTPNHKGSDGNSKSRDTYNDGGIYLDNPQAREATTLSPEARKRSKLPAKLLNAPELGCRSWNYLAVPLEAKFDPSRAAFYFHEGKGKSKSKSEGSKTQTRDSDGADTEKTTKDSSLSTSPSESDTVEEAADEQTMDNTDTSNQPEGTAAETGDPSSLPFPQKVEPFIRNTSQGLKALAQLGEYMCNTFTHQHRTFSYAIYIVKNMCRLLYFDRSGAFVTTPFDWTVTTSSLHTFLWKLARMPKADMGYDTTASLASGTECDMFKAMAEDDSVPKEVQEYVKRATSESAPIYKVRVTSDPGTDISTAEDDPKEQVFLVGRHHFAADTLVGRCTRGYIALRLQDGKADSDSLCFLKDSWRPYVPQHVPQRARPEHVVYQLLAKHKVPHVPTLVCGGDVIGSPKTVVQDFLLVNGMKPVPRIHYRLVTKEICVPVQEFRNFKELTYIFIDILRAHFYAYTEAGVLHRDISVGNIMINPVTRRGVLIDWDLSRLVEHLGSGPVEPERSGTWSTRSALMLQYPRKPCRLSDDLESIVHAYRHLTLRYHLTDVTPKLRSFIETTYEEVMKFNGVLIGGSTKLGQFASAQSPFRVIKNPHLQSVLDALAKGCFSFYDQINLDRMQEKYGIEDEARPQLAEDVHATIWIQESDQRMFETAGLSVALNHLTGAQSEGSGAQLEAGEAQLSRETSEAQSEAGSSSSLRPTDRDRDAVQAEPDDPCDIHGFLSSHGGLRNVFGLYIGYPTLLDKGDDYFRMAQPSPLFMHPPRSQTSDLASKSLSGTMEWNSMHRGSPLLGSSVSSADSQLGKRAREDASEDVSADTSGKLPEDEPASKRRA
ncbi:hypothetical protein C8Q74DRAFT_1366107 [Fomes fomentarius]|nr:hypothetical protein C8Q74DRAFT_1366107 [Fomes fomentarius]